MRKNRLIAVLIACTLAASVASAQTYPAKPIRVINPYTAGGGIDAILRPLTQKMSEGLRQQLPVDNRPGANGQIGMELGAKAPPDGYTLVVGTTGSLCMNASVYPKMRYDPVKDFAPISNFADSAFILSVHPSVPAKNVKELIALAKAQPNKLTYATFGVGSSSHLGAELLSMLAGIRMIHVPYKGTVPMNTDLVAGNVMMSLDSMQSVMPFIRAGRLRAIGIAAEKRSPAAPDIPTIIESGVPGFVVGSWYGLLAPANTPRDIVTKLNAEIIKALASPEVKERFQSFGTETVGSTPEEFAALIRSDIEKWAKVVRVAGIKPEE